MDSSESADANIETPMCAYTRPRIKTAWINCSVWTQILVRPRPLGRKRLLRRQEFASAHVSCVCANELCPHRKNLASARADFIVRGVRWIKH
jgi:hypothetical protein